MWRNILLIGAAILLAGSIASANPVINNTGLSAPDQTITFSEFSFATGTPITNQYSSLGVTFSPSLYYNVQPQFFPGDFLASFDFVNTSNPASILFTQDQTEAAFAMQTNPGTSLFEAYLDGILIESFSAATNFSYLPDLTHASDFYGFTGIVFDEIRITGPVNGAFQIDNLQLSTQAPIPEPTSLLLLCTGLGAIGLAAWRRKKA